MHSISKERRDSLTEILNDSSSLPARPFSLPNPNNSTVEKQSLFPFEEKMNPIWIISRPTFSIEQDAEKKINELQTFTNIIDQILGQTNNIESTLLSMKEKFESSEKKLSEFSEMCENLSTDEVLGACCIPLIITNTLNRCGFPK